MKRRIFKAVIFDMDGVLVNTEPHHIIIEKRLFDGLKLNISDEEHSDYLGVSSLRMWQMIVDRHGLRLKAEDLARRNIEEIRRYFSRLNGIETIPGADLLLEELQKEGIPAALASGTDPDSIDIILSGTGLKNYFVHVVSSVVTGKSKPDPDIYLFTAGLLNVAPEDCLVIEDSTNGIRAAKSAGMYCIAYRGDISEPPDQSMADEIVDDLRSLNGIIKKRG